jgi:hypothetical protein
MRRTIGLAVLVLSLFEQGCAVTATRIYGSDGNPYEYVDCGGLVHSLKDCYLKASEVCPSGYRVTDNVAPRGLYDSSLIISCK